MGKKIGFTWSVGPGNSDEPETSDNTDEVIPLHVDQPGVDDLEYWQEDD